MGVRRLVISGGEPLVRPDLIRIMHHAHRRRMRFGLVTNSYLVEDLWNELKNFKYFLFYTSIDGLAPYHDGMRLAHSFERALKALERFKRLGVRTRIVNTVMQKRNLDQLDPLLDILKSSAASDWRLSPLVNIGRARDKDDICLDGRDLRTIKNFISLNRLPSLKIDFGESCSYLGCLGADFDGRPFFCGAGLTRCDIMPDGEVLGCQEVYDNAYSEGNIRRKSFPRIWREGFKRFRSGRELPLFCEGCRHFCACGGGCWARMQRHEQCLKAVWEISS
jgi:radical SAM protein with 4Fe4S-binding SPASM domain